MPLYVYKCNDCDHQFEVRQRFSDEPLTVCPNCKGHIRRVINPVGVVFKGSGFYVTDSRNGKSGMLNGSSHSSTENKDTKSETKTEDSSTTAVATDKKAEKKPSVNTSGAAPASA
ncbi:MAG: FmdB family zinc ribbon protein [Candidatus Promineifilaceae bacterium]